MAVHPCVPQLPDDYLCSELWMSFHCSWKCWEWRNVSRKDWCQLADRTIQGTRFHAEDWTTCSGLYHGRFPRAWLEVYARLDGACPSGLAWPHWWWKCCRSLPNWQHVGRLNPCPCGRWLQREQCQPRRTWKSVLILVLVEDGFREGTY